MSSIPPVFHFQHFDVRHERSAMKVNTDAVLLGTLLTLPSMSELAAEGSACVSTESPACVSAESPCRPCRVLDVGTGTGVIALILAQRLAADSAPAADSAHADQAFAASVPVEIVGIDIDLPSAKEAAENFAASPWSSCLSARPLALQQMPAGEKWDLICSNPPYFESSLKNPDVRLSQARHTDQLSYVDIFSYASEHLKEGGTLAFVLPYDLREKMIQDGEKCGFFLSREILIKSTACKFPKRFVSEWKQTSQRSDSSKTSRDNFQSTQTESLILMQDGHWTPEYLELVSDFLYLGPKNS